MKIRLRPDVELDGVNSEYLSHGTVYEVLGQNHFGCEQIVDDVGDIIAVNVPKHMFDYHVGALGAWEIVEE